MDCGSPGSSVQGILQARTLEGVAIPFSRGSSWPGDQTQVSYITGRLFTIWATREARPPCSKKSRYLKQNMSSALNYCSSFAHSPSSPDRLMVNFQCSDCQLVTHPRWELPVWYFCYYPQFIIKISITSNSPQKQLNDLQQILRILRGPKTIKQIKRPFWAWGLRLSDHIDCMPTKAASLSLCWS